MNRTQALAAFTAYVLSVVAANYATARYGLISALPGILVTAGTYAAGTSLIARDIVQDTAGRAAVIAGIVVGAGISSVTASPILAVASGAAFLTSELADMAVYTPLRRHGWARAVLASNVVGAAIDTAVFLAIAPFPLSWPVFAGQMVVKAVWVSVAVVGPVALWRVVKRT